LEKKAGEKINEKFSVRLLNSVLKQFHGNLEVTGILQNIISFPLIVTLLSC
jgi:hypothetical protein